MTYTASKKYKALIAKIDQANADDPRRVMVDGQELAFETLYSERMMEVLERLYPLAGELLAIAARAQHIRRWEIPRDKYAKGREGYNKWRHAMRALHAQIVGKFMREEGYEGDEIELISQYLQKKQLKKNADSQALENVVDIVFLQYYLADFAAKYSHYDEDKMIDIIGKTLRKMSSHGHKAALEIDYPAPLKHLVLAALEREKDCLAQMVAKEKF